MMNTINRPGLLVRDKYTGTLGITTDTPRKRTPNIAVQWVGGNYPVLARLDELELAEGVK